MAQYYQVLSQADDKSVEEVTQFYPNLEENPTVQYVIAADGGQQQFQTQPVVVSSDQLMVVEGQGQQVIIDQSQLTYQSPSYVIQETSGVDFQNTPRQQQVYYMANTNQSPSIVVEQPVVLNQLMQNQLPKVMNTPLSQNCQTATATTQQMKTQLKTPTTVVKQNLMNARGVAINVQKAQNVPGVVQTFPRKNTPIQKDKTDESIALSDGTTMSYTQYRKLVNQQKQQQNQVMQRKPPRTPVPNRIRPSRPNNKQSPARFNRNHSFMSDSSNEVEQNMQSPPQFSNNVQSRQNINRHLQQQNQYLIQPARPRDNKPQNAKPLPNFLHTTQIENIINSTPMSEEYSDSIRMLVLLDNGEQRLITFTLPKEACTIHEILEQVGVPFTAETPIQVEEANSNGLNYIVAVGNVPGFNSADNQQNEENDFISPTPIVESESTATVIESSIKPPSPEPPKDLPPKLIEGQLAVCAICGYLSEDFNKCLRCKRRLPENVKAIPATDNTGKKVDPRSGEKRLALQKVNGIPRMNLLPKKRPPKPKLIECETVVLSSDDEESEKKTPVKNVNEQLLEKLGASVTISPISKEPSILDIQKTSILATTKGPNKVPAELLHITLITCRTIRIGSYRFVPPEPVRIDSNSLTIKVPHPINTTTVKHIKIETRDIVKVLISFQKSLPVLFYYLLPSVGAMIRLALDMAQGSDYYFDPLSDVDEAYKRITLLPETLSEECKQTLHKIYQKNINLDELTYKEANDILIKTCPKELSKSIMNYSVSEIKPILVYPPEGRGRITINTEDYMCLGQDQFLNDVIIDFYLKYLVQNLPKEQQDKVHVFSTFFYKRLTTKPVKASRKSQPAELDPNLSPAQKRHTRVKTWTKNVNIFEKDFIIVPINENCHWFLAIICFPNLNGCQTMDGQPIKIEPKTPKKKKTVATNSSNVTVSISVKEKKVEQSIMCEDSELSDKDEAEGDESELDSDDSEEALPTLSVENNSNRPPIKQPCILIFDSLAGASRSRVVATLRDYLTCEYRIKMNTEKMFTKDVIKGACPKVPQQTNFTDCGLYLLQYVEQFFQDPIKDYYIPILHLKTWFKEITVTKKREDLSILIQSLMKQTGKDLELLPEVIFPTLNGELTDRALAEKEENNKFIDPENGEEMMEDEDEDYLPPQSKNKKKPPPSCEKGDNNSPIKPSNESVNKNEFSEQPVINTTTLKPDISELPKQSCKDTLNYLKAKRIIRHKNVNDGGPEIKKIKNMESPTSGST